jgi:hypothetical protein
VLILSLIAALGAPPGLVAQEEHEGGATESEGHHGGHGEEFEKNSIAIFIGATQAEKEDGERESPEFTFGIDYERRLSKVFGVGAVVDFVASGSRERIIAAAAVFHAGEAKLVVAPGVEYLKESGDREGILRLGLMYAFPAGKIHLEPSVFWDVTQEGGTWVWGLTIGKPGCGGSPSAKSSDSLVRAGCLA